MRAIFPSLIRYLGSTSKKGTKIWSTHQTLPNLQAKPIPSPIKTASRPSSKIGASGKQEQIYNICENLRLHHKVLTNSQQLFIDQSYVLSNIDFNACSMETLASMMTTMPQIQNYKQKYLKRVMSESQNIDFSQPMANNLLLSYMIIFEQLTNYLIYMKFLHIFSKQFNSLETDNYEKYIWLMSKRKIPDKIEIQLFQKWKKKVKNEAKNMSLIKVINLFNIVVPMNDCLWDTVDLLIVLQNRIYQKINNYSLTDAEIIAILNYKCQLNIFRYEALRRLVQSVDGSGNTPHEKHLEIFICQVGHAQRLVLNSRNTDLLFRFVVKRLDNQKLIMNVIESHILPRQYLKRLVQTINQSSCAQKYQNDECIYQIIRRGLQSQQESKELLEKVKQKMKKAAMFSNQFYVAANTVDFILFNDTNNLQANIFRREVEQSIQNRVAQMDLNDYKAFSNQGKYGKQFITNFSKCIFKTILPKLVENRVNISDGLLFDIVLSGNESTLLEILAKCPQVISQRQIYLLLNYSQLNPLYFLNSYSMLSILLHQNIASSSGIRLIRKSLNYICNQQIQSSLNKSCLSNYLQLVRKFIKEMKLKQLTNSFITYLTDSKTLNVRFQPIEFLGILKDLENHVLENSNHNSVYVLLNLIQELIKVNKLSAEYARKILARTNKFQFVNHIQQYIDFTVNYSQEHEHKKSIKLATDLVILVKSKYIKQSQLKCLIPQCQQLIKTLHFSSLQSILANFELPPNPVSILLLNLLLDRYIQAVIPKNSKRIYFVVERAQYLCYRGYITIDKYNALAKKSFDSLMMKKFIYYPKRYFSHYIKQSNKNIINFLKQVQKQGKKQQEFGERQEWAQEGSEHLQDRQDEQGVRIEKETERIK